MQAQNKTAKADGHQAGGVVRTLIDEQPTAPSLSLGEQAEQLRQQKNAITEQENELELRMQEATEQEQNRKLDEYNSLREDADGFRQTAAKTEDEENKRLFVLWALDADRQATVLARELGLAINEPELAQEESKAVKAVISLLKHRLGAVVQISLLVIAIWWANSNFIHIGETIKIHNAAITPLSTEEPISGYDISSAQKFFFEKWVEFWDLPVGLAKMMIMVPFVAFYMLPFVRSRKDFFTEFFEDITPYQRCVITFCFVALFVLHSALTHGVKP